MKRKLTISTALIIAGSFVLGMTVFAQDPSEEEITDRKGTFRIWNFTSHEVNLEDNGQRRIDAAGSPVRATSKSQGLTLATKKLEAVIKTQTGGGWAFDWANLTGSVQLDQDTISSQGKTTRKLTTERARIDDGADQAKITLPVKFTFTDILTPASNIPRTVAINAGSGEIHLTPLKPNTPVFLKSGTLNSAVIDILLKSQKDSSTSQVRSGKVLLVNGEQAKLTFPGSFEFENERVKPGAHGDSTSKSKITGSSGVLNLVALDALDKLEKNENPLLGATIEGPVTLVMDSTNFREVGEDAAKKIVKEFNNVQASGSKLTYNKAENKIRLEGQVSYSYETWRDGDAERNPLIGKTAWLEVVLAADGITAKTVRTGSGSASKGGGQ